MELMIVVAILGILMSIAAPAFSEWIASQRVRDTASDIHSSLVRARQEAVSRSTSIQIVPVSSSWANGWSIANPDYAGTFIEQHGPLQNTTVSGAGTVTFTSVGRLSGAALGIKITATGTSLTRCITVDTAGRPKTRAIAAADTCS